MARASLPPAIWGTALSSRHFSVMMDVESLKSRVLGMQLVVDDVLLGGPSVPVVAKRPLGPGRLAELAPLGQGVG